MPIGYLIAILWIAVCTFFAVVAPGRPRFLASASFWLGMVVGELPFVALYWIILSTVLAATDGSLGKPLGLVALGLAVLSLLALVSAVVRGLRAPGLVAIALRDGIGTEPPPRRPPGRT